jgi:hypothetical protein
MNRYLCYDKPRSDGYWARDITFTDGDLPPVDGWTWIKNRMSPECRYDRQREDARCEGCNRMNGEKQ